MTINVAIKPFLKSCNKTTETIESLFYGSNVDWTYCDQVNSEPFYSYKIPKRV